jgi:hypothetical protein
LIRITAVFVLNLRIFDLLFLFRSHVLPAISPIVAV